MSRSPNSPQDALIALYEADQSSTTTVSNLVLTMLGATLVYAVAMFPVAGSIADAISKEFGSKVAGGVALGAMPFLLWVISAYHSLLAVSVIMRAASSRIIEARLVAAAELEAKAQWIGVRASDRIMDPAQSTFIHAVATGVSYGGVYVAIVAYTVTLLVMSFSRMGPLAVIPSAIYAVFGVIVGWSWISGINQVKQAQEAGKAQPEA